MPTKNKQVQEPTETKLVQKPKLRLKESNHFSQVWFLAEQVKEKTGKSGKEFFVVDIEGNEIIFGKKSFINESKDGTKKGFHIQNSREYRVFGTTESILGRDLIQYSIQLNTFNKQESEK